MTYYKQTLTHKKACRYNTTRPCLSAFLRNTSANVIYSSSSFLNFSHSRHCNIFWLIDNTIHKLIMFWMAVCQHSAHCMCNEVCYSSLIVTVARIQQPPTQINPSCCLSLGSTLFSEHSYRTESNLNYTEKF